MKEVIIELVTSIGKCVMQGAFFALTFGVAFNLAINFIGVRQ